MFDPSLTRGLAYYTSTVFEIFAEEGSVKGSLSAGGRYDEMIGKLLGKGATPAVGISFGLEPILEVLKEKSKKVESTTVVYVAPIKAAEAGQKIAEELRAAGIPTDLDLK